MNNIEEALKVARTPVPLHCLVCEEKLYSPMDKLCIKLFDKCPMHLEDDGADEQNLLKISESL